MSGSETGVLLRPYYQLIRLPDQQQEDARGLGRRIRRQPDRGEEPGDQRPEQGSPTLLTVDFRVFARDGIPIRDLRPEEVTLKVGRRPRDIVAMQLVQVPTSVDTRAAAA